MILYFSGTGNTLEVARGIAEASGESLFDMGAAYKEGRFEVQVGDDDSLGIAFPTYRWSTPPLVDEFVKKARFVTASGDAFRPSYCFTVETYGYFRGRESRYLAKLLQKYQGIAVDSAYAVRSVGNCLYLFDTPGKDAIGRTLVFARESTAKVSAHVCARKSGERVSPNPLGALLSSGTCHEGKKRSVGSFYALPDKCVGCGTCVSVCPTSTVKIVEGLPRWEGGRCTECLRCVQLCPTGAAQHGKVTEKRTRYRNPILEER